MTKTFGVVHILVASETVEHRLPQQADRRYAIIGVSLAGLLLIAFSVWLRGRTLGLPLPDVGFWHFSDMPTARLMSAFGGGEADMRPDARLPPNL